MGESAIGTPSETVSRGAALAYRHWKLMTELDGPHAFVTRAHPRWQLVRKRRLLAADGRQFIGYHAWDAAVGNRQMWVDPLRWTDDGRPVVDRFTARLAECDRAAPRPR